MMSWICFFIGHELTGTLYGRNTSEEWPCERCGEDARPSWVIEMDTHDRMERIFLKIDKLKEQAAKGHGE